MRETVISDNKRECESISPKHKVSPQWRENRMKLIRKSSESVIPPPIRNLGPKFSHDDETRIALAKLSAKRFMENYGKGSKPYMVDLSHYENSKSSKL